jgi:16S rRNA G527 N7-methylase RsmG
VTDSRLQAKEIKRAWDLAREHHLASLKLPPDQPEEESGEVWGNVARETEILFPHHPLDESLVDLEAPAELFDFLEFSAAFTLEGNKRVNLVSRKDPAGQILLNILDSLPLALVMLSVSRETGVKDGTVSTPHNFMMDVGTGSGVPGIPAWLLLDALDEKVAPEHLVLVESRGRKAEFLDSLVDKMDLDSAKVFSHRLESPDLPLVFDVNGIDGPGIFCTRAVAGVDQTLKWSRGMKDKLSDGVFLKGTIGLGREWREERKRWPRSGWNQGKVHTFSYPDRVGCFFWLRNPPKPE